jgi:hypothetical protein
MCKYCDWYYTQNDTEENLDRRDELRSVNPGREKEVG